MDLQAIQDANTRLNPLRKILDDLQKAVTFGIQAEQARSEHDKAVVLREQELTFLDGQIEAQKAQLAQTIVEVNSALAIFAERREAARLETRAAEEAHDQRVTELQVEAEALRRSILA